MQGSANSSSIAVLCPGYAQNAGAALSRQLRSASLETVPRGHDYQVQRKHILNSLAGAYIMK